MREESGVMSPGKKRIRRDAEEEVNEASLSPPTDCHSVQAA